MKQERCILLCVLGAARNPSNERLTDGVLAVSWVSRRQHATRGLPGRESGCHDKQAISRGRSA